MPHLPPSQPSDPNLRGLQHLDPQEQPDLPEYPPWENTLRVLPPGADLDQDLWDRIQEHHRQACAAQGVGAPYVRIITYAQWKKLYE